VPEEAKGGRNRISEQHHFRIGKTFDRLREFSTQVPRPFFDEVTARFRRHNNIRRAGTRPRWLCSPILRQSAMVPALGRAGCGNGLQAESSQTEMRQLLALLASGPAPRKPADLNRAQAPSIKSIDNASPSSAPTSTSAPLDSIMRTKSCALTLGADSTAGLLLRSSERSSIFGR
jgi:hypothetical protein